MFRRIFGGKIQNAQGLFRDHFVEVKMLYTMEFDKIPYVSFIGEIDITKALAYIMEKYVHEIVDTCQHAYYDYDEERMLFNTIILKLNGEVIIEVAANYCQVLHGVNNYDWAINLVKELAAFRTKAAIGAPATVVGFARQTTLN